MRQATKLAAITATAFMVASTASAGNAWLHIRVDEAKSEERVSVNLPLSVVEMVLAAAPEKIVEKGRIKFHGEEHGMDVADLRAIWNELAAAGDANLVSIEKEDETVHVARQGDRLTVRVVKKEGSEEVKVDLPARVVDALLSGEGDELDIAAAFAELKTIRGDIVSVQDDGDHVRIWIDETSS